MEDHSEYIIKLLHKKNVVRDWISNKYKENPIIIYGVSGTGKTSLANYILKDFTKITINLDFCKSGKPLNEYLDMSLYKKSITMMFDNKNINKAILFDDLNYIQDYDKKLFKSIVDFSKKKVTNHPIIYVFNHINCSFFNKQRTSIPFRRKNICTTTNLPIKFRNLNITNLPRILVVKPKIII